MVEFGGLYGLTLARYGFLGGELGGGVFGGTGEVPVVVLAGAPFESFGTLIGGETRRNGLSWSFVEDRRVWRVVTPFAFAQSLLSFC